MINKGTPVATEGTEQFNNKATRNLEYLNVSSKSKRERKNKKKKKPVKLRIIYMILEIRMVKKQWKFNKNDEQLGIINSEMHRTLPRLGKRKLQVIYKRMYITNI